jgi:CRP/FNR family cyclic AMP-dependent transcriptional regulator
MNQSLEATIRNHPFFHGMKAHHIAMLFKGATEARFKAGEVLFIEGSPANRFFLLLQGSVALEAHEPSRAPAVVQCVHEGDVVGWSWLFAPFSWHLSARALEPTRVVVLDGGHLLGMAETHHEFGYELMKRVAQVVIQRFQATHRQRLGLPLEEETVRL